MYSNCNIHTTAYWRLLPAAVLYTMAGIYTTDIVTATQQRCSITHSNDHIYVYNTAVAAIKDGVNSRSNTHKDIMVVTFAPWQ